MCTCYWYTSKCALLLYGRSQHTRCKQTSVQYIHTYFHTCNMSTKKKSMYICNRMYSEDTMFGTVARGGQPPGCFCPYIFMCQYMNHIHARSQYNTITAVHPSKRKKGVTAICIEFRESCCILSCFIIEILNLASIYYGSIMSV